MNTRLIGGICIGIGIGGIGIGIGGIGGGIVSMSVSTDDPFNTRLIGGSP